MLGLGKPANVLFSVCVLMSKRSSKSGSSNSTKAAVTLCLPPESINFAEYVPYFKST